MKFKEPLIHGHLIKRYKRFLTDVTLDNGKKVTAHCTNSGSMKSCLEEGAEVYLSPANDPKRKTKFTWEMIKINGKWVGINTNHPNQIVYEAVKSEEIDQLKGYTHVKREVKFEDSRFDVYANNDQEECFIEVKNVTLKEGNAALFPDAVTTRGRKHLQTLIRVKEKGIRAVMVYVIQRMDVTYFAPADEIDPAYGKALREARKKGVEIIPVRVEVNPTSIRIAEILEARF